MSNRKMGRLDLEANSYFISNDIIPETSQRTSDPNTHDKLDALIAASGGSVDTTVAVNNIAIPDADTEQSFALPTNVKRFILRSRTRGKLQVGFATGESASNYFTIPAGCNYEDANLYSSLTIYFQSNKAGDTLELITYV